MCFRYIVAATTLHRRIYVSSFYYRSSGFFRDLFFVVIVQQPIGGDMSYKEYLVNFETGLCKYPNGRIVRFIKRPWRKSRKTQRQIHNEMVINDQMGDKVNV